MPKITADIPEELYRFVRGTITDQRLAGEPTTVSTFVTDLLYKWKNGGLLRRRRGGALSSDPIEESTSDSQPVEVTTIGQDIDDIFAVLSQEERNRIREIMVPLARELVRRRQSNMGGEK
jgi:hypothetical protein